MKNINPFIPIDIDDYEIRKAWSDGWNAGYKSMGLTFIFLVTINVAILLILIFS